MIRLRRNECRMSNDAILLIFSYTYNIIFNTEML
jgi:hypothetical protein